MKSFDKLYSKQKKKTPLFINVIDIMQKSITRLRLGTTLLLGQIGQYICNVSLICNTCELIQPAQSNRCTTVDRLLLSVRSKMWTQIRCLLQSVVSNNSLGTWCLVANCKFKFLSMSIKIFLSSDILKVPFMITLNDPLYKAQYKLLFFSRPEHA